MTHPKPAQIKALKHRYIVVRNGETWFKTDSPAEVAIFMWGRDSRHYVLYVKREWPTPRSVNAIQAALEKDLHKP